MPRAAAITILGGFSLLGLLAAGWGLSDISAALTAMRGCAAKAVIDNSAFWFLGLSVLPLFLLLAPLPHRWHTRLLAAITALFILLPAGGLLVFQHSASAAGYVFTPDLSLFGLREFSAPRPLACSG
ncbi:hypothetical protein [Leisingera sp. ANG-M7]|uniref:hypothetical protein n=1 Tax=Leisingera sp. ANG-M7 TaxID=1577902 RepID=UPI00057E834E|nr:hypothetical protein [Leisingera sp. ANG-M7]KIC34154.1 hypothetical protein RA26_20320 [Leisingera sp. ANG-M7]